MNYKKLSYILTSLFLFNVCAFSQTSPIRRINFSDKGIRQIKTTKVPTPEITERNKSNPPLIIAIEGMRFAVTAARLEKQYRPKLEKILRSPDLNISEEDAKFILGMIDEELNKIYNPPPGANPAKPKDYLPKMLEAAKKDKGMNAEIVKLDWNQDPGYSAKYVKQMKKQFTEAYARAVKENRPLTVISYSWGTMLANEVMLELYEDKSDVVVDKYITFGCPTLSEAPITKLFLKIEAAKTKMKMRADKLPNAKQWINMYGNYDSFSAYIPAADVNIETDKSVLPIVEKLKNDQSPAAQELVKKLTGTDTWHDAYIYPINIVSPELKVNYKRNFSKEYAKIYLSK